ncbi:MAG: iron dependent repressor, metal binding and dimerization domain protein [Bacteroidota bacterium]
MAEKLKFSWEEVHAVAEDLEHVSSKKLIDKLDEFLGFPALIRMAIPFLTPMAKSKRANRYACRSSVE